MNKCEGCLELERKFAELEQTVQLRNDYDKASIAGYARCCRGCGRFATRLGTVAHTTAGTDNVPQLLCDECEPVNVYKLVPGGSTCGYRDIDSPEQIATARRLNAQRAGMQQPEPPKPGVRRIQRASA